MSGLLAADREFAFCRVAPAAGLTGCVATAGLCGGAFAHGMELTASQGAHEMAARQAAPRRPRTRDGVIVRCTLTVGTDGDVRAERYLLPPGGLDDDVL